MELNNNALEGVRLAGDSLFISDEVFFNTCDNVYEVLLQGKNAEEIIACEKGVDGCVMKQAVYGLVTLIVESARNYTEQSVLNSLLEDCKWPTDRIEHLNKINKSKSKELQIKLGRITTSFPHIVDADWKLDYNVKSSQLDSVNSFKYTIDLKTQKHNGGEGSIKFQCTVDELQDLVSKLKEASKSIQKACRG